MEILLILATLVAAYFIHSTWCLARNYYSARSFGVPLLVFPIDPNGFPYIIAKVPLQPVFKALLPASIYETLQVSIFGWQFRDRGEMHARFGPVFAYVTPGSNELWIADPAMAYDVLARTKDFGPANITKFIMSVLGPNVITADGESWKRQRKLVAPNLNERIMETVWMESRDQATEMARFLLDQPQGVTDQSIDSLRTIAINVIGMAGYGQKRKWSAQPVSIAAKKTLTYFDCIHLVMLNLLPAAFFSPAILRLPFMPAMWRQLGKGMANLPASTRKMLQELQHIDPTKAEERRNFMTMLVKLSNEAKEEAKGGRTSGSQFLSDEEIQGNLFVFTGAGYDTTSNTMAYAVTMLAAHPEWQTWMQEELDEIMPEASASVNYKDAFPQLIRCLAVMYETLRHFPPLVHIQKEPASPQTLNGQSSEIRIPGKVQCYVNTVALNFDPRIWGDDVHDFRPSRWLTRPTDGSKPTLINSARGSFLPWSTGPRVCPGMKMSQVEFASAIGTLFRHCDVEPAPKDGWSDEDLKRHLLHLTQDSLPRTTLQMNRPLDVVLKWSKRG